MTVRIRGNEFQTTLVCIDSYENGVLNGRFYNPYLKGGESFQSLSQFLIRFEQALDTMNLPQSFNAHRSFVPTPVPKEENLSLQNSERGLLATFSLRVLFRQNSSWQGTVTWLEEHQEMCFRSVLELIHLMDSTLQESSGTDLCPTATL